MRRALVALLVGVMAVPASAGDRHPEKPVLQTLGGASAGLALGLGTAFAGIILALEEEPGPREKTGIALVIASPLVFAAAEAGAVHLIGRHYDGRDARFWPTFGGAVAGTAAGLLVWRAREESTSSFVLGVGVATAGTVAGYALGRDRGALRVGKGRLALGVPTVSPRAALAPDGRVRYGADVRVLDVRF